jgi:hypothetical protein
MARAITLSPAHETKDLIFVYLIMGLTLFMLPLMGNAQTVVVNPDGSHSLVICHGSTNALIVNPDGTHTQVFNHGDTQVRVNPNGSHTVILHSDTDTPLIVNPDGTHTRVLNAHSETPLVIHPDGTQSQYILNGDTFFHPCPKEKKVERNSVKESRKTRQKMKL